jgi:hypothetical protein
MYQAGDSLSMRGGELGVDHAPRVKADFGGFLHADPRGLPSSSSAALKIRSIRFSFASHYPQETVTLGRFR